MMRLSLCLHVKQTHRADLFCWMSRWCIRPERKIETLNIRNISLWAYLYEPSVLWSGLNSASVLEVSKDRLTLQRWQEATSGSLGGVSDDLVLALCPPLEDFEARLCPPAMSDIHKDDSPLQEPLGDTGGEAWSKISRLLLLSAAPSDKGRQGKLWSCWQALSPFGTAALTGEVVITLDCWNHQAWSSVNGHQQER